MSPAPLVTSAQLQQLAPRSNFAVLAPLISAAAVHYAITTPLRLAHWLAQGAFESQGFELFEESLNYSAERLCQVWPGRFRTLADAEPFAYSPQKLADAVYAGRMGNTGPNDGWEYRGRGVFQLTGKDAYAQVGRICGQPYVDHPDMVAGPEGAADTAGGFWKWKDCNALADCDDVAGVTLRVNGGLNGLTDRQAWLRRTKAIWAVSPPPAAPSLAQAA